MAGENGSVNLAPRLDSTVAATVSRLIAAAASTAAPAATADPAVEAVQILGFAVAAVGLAMNAVALAAVYSASMRNRALRLGLLSLACSDSLMALSTAGLLGLEYHSAVARHWLRADEQGAYRTERCAIDICRWMWAVGSDGHLFTLAVLAGQQFVAIRWPLRTADGVSPRGTRIALAAAWAASAALGMAPAMAIAAATENHPLAAAWPTKGTTRFCYQRQIYLHTVSKEPRRYGFELGQTEFHMAMIGLDVVKMSGALVAMGVSYGYVMYVMGRSADSGCRSAGSCGSSAEALTAANRRRDRKRVFVVTATVTLLCISCYLPLFILNILNEMGCNSCYRPIDGATLWVVGVVPSVADPLIYTLRLDAVRRGALAVLSRFRRQTPKRKSVDGSSQNDATSQNDSESRTRQTLG